MKSPRGFARNYFTFASILAYSVQGKLQSQQSVCASLLHPKLSIKEDEELEDEVPIELLGASVLQNTKACHCNCIFKIKIRLILLLNHFIPRCPYYTVCFAYRRTGVHPPLY